MGNIAAHNKFAHLYINGLYWGFYNISERMDDDFMDYYLNGDKDDFDIIKDYAEVAAGNSNEWDTMMELAGEGLSDAKSYYGIQGKDEFGNDDPSKTARLNVDNLIDYMLLNFYVGNLDWDHHNWVAAINRNDHQKGFQFFPWDSERTLYGISNNVVDEKNKNRPSFLFSQLKNNPIFRNKFRQRANELLAAGGLLGPDNAATTWYIRAKEIDLAVIAESARWGDYRRDKHPYKDDPYELYTRNGHWLIERNRMMNEYFPKRSQIVLEQLREIGLAGDIIAGNETINTSDWQGFHVYPTPFSTQVNINFGIKNPGSTEIMIYSPEGKVAHFSKETYKNPGQKQFTWQPENAISGIYIYKIKTNDILYSGKLIYIQ
jgi:hypothetical protein